jgi:hypothetical protein
MLKLSAKKHTEKHLEIVSSVLQISSKHATAVHRQSSMIQVSAVNSRRLCTIQFFSVSFYFKASELFLVMENLCVIIKSLLRTTQHSSMKLIELEKDFYQQEGIDLTREAKKFGFLSTEELLRSFSELEIFGQGFAMSVRCKEMNHVARMNQFRKFVETSGCV